ncbi:cilia- and flagella-associated protein 221-like isoform X2 [Rhodnius prolixus]|uniref:cilia- and flagella-associated protein 221-like isoform X2 n=1 Tax=Rhodnius prolixus TaxID=13249 RepID=UPI003D189079
MSCSNSSCSLILVKPRQVLMHFNIDKYSRIIDTVTVINKTKNTEIIKVQLPMTKYFYLEALPKKVLVNPGGKLELTVYLAKLTEQRIHYDSFTVICKNNCHHEIQLEAEPHHKILDEIPKALDFGHVPLGYIARKVIKFSPNEKKIGFLFLVISCNPDFTINPTRGIISDKPMEIELFYKPTAYITFRTAVQVYFPLLMSTPLCFYVSAHTKPGYERDKILEAAAKHDELETCQKIYRPISLKTVLSKEFIVKDDELKLNLYRTKQLFFEKPDPNEKLKYELIGPLGRYLDTEAEIKRSKEIEFNEYIIKTRNENNATHNNTKLSSSEEFNKDLERMMEWDTYKNLLKPPINWKTITGPEFIRQRTVNYYSAREQPQFTNRIPSLWFVRYVIMTKFIDAGRKIILRNRMLKALSILRVSRTQHSQRIYSSTLSRFKYNYLFVQVLT